MVLRAASHVMPTYLRFVFSLERRVNNFAKIDKTLKLLMSRTTASVNDSEYWNAESESLIQKKAVDQATVVALNKKYKDLCKLIADTSKPDNQKTTQDILNTQDELKLLSVENPGVKVVLSMMTILYGPVDAEVFQYTS